jgi:primosomal protein N' (replication factor Y)
MTQGMGKRAKSREAAGDRQFVEVAVALPVFKALTYEVPPALRSQMKTGKRVLVPVRNRQITGYVLGHVDSADYETVKKVGCILDEAPIFPASMVPFFRWIADYYLYPLGEVIKGALPAGITTKEMHTFTISDKGRTVLSGRKSLDALHRTVLGTLQKNSTPLTAQTLSRQLGRHVRLSNLASLERSGLVERQLKLRQGRVRPKKERYVTLIEKPRATVKLSKAREKIMTMLEGRGEISMRALRAQKPSAGRLADKMAADGLLDIVEREVYRDPFGMPIELEPIPPLLTGEQANAVTEVIDALGGGFQTFLLHGITGSGKTEVYMQTAAAAIEKGHEALVLVPEIALISQTERLFRARFGDCVALLHSGLSQGERFDQWMRIVRKQVKIAIGPRSALFAPFEQLGLIIVDEEHDDSYKQESKLRYHARDLAVVRAKIDGALAILGSATPSVQSYHNVRAKKYRGLSLKKRIDDQALPAVEIVDLRETSGYRRAKPFITDELKAAMDKTLGRGEQVLLFLNRRGFANYPTCTSCGQPVRCKHCDVTMTLHQSVNAFKCHYCGHSYAQPAGCPNCGNPKMRLIGLGTERVEAKVKTIFPKARVARMDRDAITRKGALIGILKNLRNGQIDILIGTQMVAKGHHYPNITLVGILCADLSLNFPDFRAGERTFQLLAQVAGRAGRGTTHGRVILQTFNPEHFSIVTARDQDFMAFYRQEIVFRKGLAYPPYARLAQILITGKDKERTARHAKDLGILSRKVQSKNKLFSKNVQILGPVVAPLARIKQQYRWQLLLKGKSVEALHGLVTTLRAEMERHIPRKSVRVFFDIDPVNML